MAYAIGLTPREFKALLSICLKGARSPPEIADLSRIPKSKIYEVLDSLVNKKILQSDNRKYSVCASSLADIRETYEKHSKDFGRFLGDLEEYAGGRTEHFIELTRKKLRNLFVELNYSISDPTDTKNEFLREYLQFVATSPSSGNRIAVVFTDQRTHPLSFYGFIIAILQRNLLDSLLCVYSPDTSKAVIETMSKRSKQDRDIVLISLAELDDDNLKQIRDHFVEFDNRWRHMKRDLEDLSKPLEDFKQSLATIMKTTQELRLNIENAEDFRDAWRDVVERVAADVKYEETIPTNINPLTHVPEKVLEYI
jgi:hypothetical protein